MYDSTVANIRKVESSEIHLIHELAHRIWLEAYQSILVTEQLNYMLEFMYAVPVLEQQLREGVEFYILRIGEQDQGYASLEKLPDGNCKLQKIYLAGHLRGRGLGKILLSDMEDRALKQGASRLVLNVNRQNKAVGFYESQGYQIVETVDNPIGEGWFMNDFIMQKNL